MIRSRHDGISSERRRGSRAGAAEAGAGDGVDGRQQGAEAGGLQGRQLLPEARRPPRDPRRLAASSSGRPRSTTSLVMCKRMAVDTGEIGPGVLAWQVMVRVRYGIATPHRALITALGVLWLCTRYDPCT